MEYGYVPQISTVQPTWYFPGVCAGTDSETMDNRAKKWIGNVRGSRTKPS